MLSLLLVAFLCIASPAQAVSSSVSPTMGMPSITGKVIDRDQHALPGATVWLWQDRDVRKTETNDQGEFSFVEAAPIPSDLVAHKEEYAFGGVFVAVPGMEPVTIILGQETDVMRVCVKDDAFQPVSGARLRNAFVNDSFSLPVEDLVSLGFPDIRSDEEGHLVIPDMPREGYARLLFGHRRYADTTVVYLPTGEKERTIVIRPGVELRGRVTNPEGGGVARARVAAFRSDAAGRRETSETLTDPEGFYHFTVKPGEYRIAVRHPSYASPEPRSVTLEADVEPAPLDLSLATGYDLLGRVLLPGDIPAPGIEVSYWIGKAEYETVFTQCDGAFLLRVPQSEGSIRIRPPDGFMTDTLAEIPIKGKMEKTTSLASVRLKPLPAVTGVVVDQAGAAQPNVLISSLDVRPPLWAITDGDGKFSILLRRAPETTQDPASSPRKARFRAEHAQHFLRADFDVLLDQSKPVDVALSAFDPNIATRNEERNQNDLSALIDKPAPELACDAWINGPAATITGLRGKVIVLFFWAGFDNRPEAFDRVEELRALYDLLKVSEDVVFVGIHDGGDDAAKIEKYVADLGIKFLVGRDGEPFTTFERYTIRYIPQIVLVDKRGIVRFFEVQGRLLELIKSLRREGI